MNNATLEHLLQIAVPPRDAGPSANRARGGAPPFDSLFRQASAPQDRTKSASEPTPASSPVPQSRASDPKPMSAKSEPASTQSSASDTDSEYAAASTAEEKHDEPERDELESTDALAVSAVAAPTGAPAHEAAAEVALVGEVEQAIDTAESGVESKTKSESKAVSDTRVHDEVPIDAAAAKVKPTEVAGENKEAAVPDAVVEIAAEATPQPEIAATAQSPISATDEAKARSRTASNKHEDTSETDRTQSVDANSEPAAEQATTKEAADPSGDAQPSFETAASEITQPDAEPKPTANHNDLRAEDQPRATNASSDAVPTPIRPAAATSVPIAANVQQQTQTADAATNNVAANDAKANTTAVRTKESALSPFARLERNQTGASRSGQAAANGNATHHVDPARFVGRVARAIHTAQERGGPLPIRLSPPELGAMRMELSVKQGTLTATIETDNTAARQVLLENLPALRERLAEQNVKIERFDVDVRRDGSGQQNPAAQHQNEDAQQARTSARGPTFRNVPNQTTGDEPIALRRTITNSSINVIA